MGVTRRRLVRVSRPVRQLIEIARRRRRVWLVEDVNDPQFHSRLPPNSHGLITGFAQIFKQPTIDRFETLVNLHPSLLPFYRGPDPFYWLGVNDEERSGYTLHRVTQGVDAGPIIHQEVVTISAREARPAVVAAALPTVTAWVRHVALGEPVVGTTVDATSIYKVLCAYGPFPPGGAASRRGHKTRYVVSGLGPRSGRR